MPPNQVVLRGLPDPGLTPTPSDVREGYRGAQDSIPDSRYVPHSQARGVRTRWILGLVLLGITALIAVTVGRRYLEKYRGTASSAQQTSDARVAAFLTEAEKRLDEGDFEGAREQLDKASVLADRDPAVLAALARLEAMRADSVWLRLRLLDPKNASLVQSTHRQLGSRVGRAKEALTRALEVAPENPAVIRARVDILRLAGELEEARKYVAPLSASASPEDAYVLAALDLAEPQPAWASVIDRLRTATGSERGLGRARAALIYALVRSGQISIGRSELQKVTDRAEGDPLYSDLEAFVGRYADAAADAGPDGQAEVATVDPASLPILDTSTTDEPAAGDFRSQLKQAQSALKQGQLNRAEQLFNSVLAKESGNTEAMAGLAEVARQRKDPEAAAKMYDKVLKSNPSYLPALIGRADQKWDAGDRKGAIALYRKVLEQAGGGSSYGQRAAARIAEGEGGGPPPPTTTAAPKEPEGTDRTHRAQGARGKEGRTPHRHDRSSGVQQVRRLVVLVLALLLVSSCRGRTRASGSSTLSGPTAFFESVTKKVVEINLTRGAPESTEGGGLFPLPASRTFVGLVRALERVRDDQDAKGVFVRFGEGSLGYAKSDEVGRLLAEIRAKGKPVVCHSHGLDNSSTWLALVGCDRIWLSPAGEVSSVGLAGQVVFVKGTLDKLKVKADFLHFGKYKSAVETFTRDSPSDSAREALTETLRSIRKIWLDGIAASRKNPKLKDDVEHGPWGAQEAKNRGLVDEVGYESDALDDVKKRAGAERVSAGFGSLSDGKSSPDLGDLIRVLAGGDERAAGRPHIAVVVAEGGISMESGGFFDSGGITAKAYTKLFRRLAKDDSVKVVVLRIDSPGGSALASDILWHEVRELEREEARGDFRRLDGGERWLLHRVCRLSHRVRADGHRRVHRRVRRQARHRRDPGAIRRHQRDHRREPRARSRGSCGVHVRAHIVGRSHQGACTKADGGDLPAVSRTCVRGPRHARSQGPRDRPGSNLERRAGTGARARRRARRTQPSDSRRARSRQAR